MQQGSSNRLIKKSSKMPERVSVQETVNSNEQNMQRTRRECQRKVNIFQMPPMFKNEKNTEIKSKITRSSVEQELMKKAAQASIKKELEQRKKKGKYARVNTKNLSLIQQTQSQDCITSSENDSILNESSIEEVSSSDMSQEYIERKMNNAFFEDQGIDILNKTIVMSKKKVPKEFQIPKSPSSNIKRQIQLSKLAHQFTLDQFNELFNQNRIAKNDYLRILEIKKQQSIKLKQQKFCQNYQKIQRFAHIIHGNFRLLYEKLKIDIDSSKNEIENMTKAMLEMHPNKGSSQYDCNPQRSKLQLKMLEKLSETKAKQNFQSILRDSLSQFQTNYNVQIQKIECEKNSKQNYSQNLIFRQIKEFLKLGQQLYHHFISSLRKDRKTGRSLIASNAREHYLNLLEQKQRVELKKINEFINEEVKQSVISLQNSQDKRQLNEEILQQFIQLAHHKVTTQFQQTRQTFQQNVAWIKMVRNKGQLKEGNAFMNALIFLSANQPTNVSIQEHKYNFLTQSFKFYRRQIFRKLEGKAEPIERLLMLFSKEKQGIKLKRQKTKLKQIKCRMQKFSRKISIAQNFLKGNSLIGNSKCVKKSKVSQIENNDSNANKYAILLKAKIQNLTRLNENASNLLVDQMLYTEPQNVNKRPLISLKSVCILDLKQKQAEFQKQNNTNSRTRKFSMSNWQNNVNSKYKLERNIDDIRAEVQSSRQNLENYTNGNKSNSGIYDKKGFKQDLLGCLKQSDKKYTQQQKQKHFDKVYELILNKQIATPKLQKEDEYKNEPYQPLSIWESRQRMFSTMKLSGYKPQMEDDFSIFDHSTNDTHLNQSSISNNSSSKFSQSSTSFSSLNQPFSVQQVQLACQRFAKYFFTNPDICKQLKLDDKQFHFLMSPDYRKYFIDKKIKDQQLIEKILSLARNNTPPLNQRQSMYPEAINNPAQYMMQIDPYFQQKIEQYQCKIVKNEQYIDSQPKLNYYSKYDDNQTRDQSCQDFGFLNNRIYQMQENRIVDYLSQKDNQSHETRDQQFYQDWLFD